MFKSKRKLDKKKAVSMIRRFIGGEDITSEIVPMSYGLAVLTTSELNKLRLVKQYGVEPIEGMSVIHDGVEIMFGEWCAIEQKIKSAVVLLPTNGRERPSWASDEQILWNEVKTYPDPEIAGIRYQNPANCPTIEANTSERPNSSEEIEGRIEGLGLPSDTPPNHRKERVNIKLLELQHINELMRTRKEAMDNFTKMNNEFLTGWFQ